MLEARAARTGQERHSPEEAHLHLIHVENKEVWMRRRERHSPRGLTEATEREECKYRSVCVKVSVAGS